MNMNWNEVAYFQESEFPPGVTDKVSRSYFYRLDFFRSQLGSKVFPSPLVEGWVRTDGSKTSRHYIGENGDERQSDAGDVFIECDPFYAMIIAIECGFTGIGLYFDTQYKGQSMTMMHLDTRPGRPVIWTRVDGEYKTIFPRPNTDFSTLLKEGARP